MKPTIKMTKARFVTEAALLRKADSQYPKETLQKEQKHISNKFHITKTMYFGKRFRGMIEAYHSKLEEEKQKEHNHRIIAQEKIKLKHHSKDHSERRREKYEDCFPSDP